MSHESPIITGLHHVTVIAGNAQDNLDFYTGVLGLRLVKKSVNQDVPGTYHLFYADGDAHAGTDLTFFPWPDLPPGRQGAGLTNEVALAVPAESLPVWVARLEGQGLALEPVTERFGERTLTFRDPHGVHLALVETSDPREFTPWAGSPVAEAYQIRGLHAVRVVEHDYAPTIAFLQDSLGFVEVGQENGWRRFALRGGGSGRLLDLKEDRAAPRGAWGVGAVHHVAWRVPDGKAQLQVQRHIFARGTSTTQVIDRFWFTSIYFREPGGALFEVATDGPGFAVDEPLESLGERLVLPPWLELRREEIEAGLPVLRTVVGK